MGLGIFRKMSIKDECKEGKGRKTCVGEVEGKEGWMTKGIYRRGYYGRERGSKRKGK